MNIKNKNILELLLKQLNVKFTNAYAKKLYRENPYRNTLFGISRMLADYGIDTRGRKIKDKNEVHSLKVPFWMLINDEIALVHTIANNQLSCVWREQEIKIPIEEFKEVWDGKALFVEKTEKTAEPEYKENFIKQLFQIFQKKTLAVCTLLLALIGFIVNDSYNQLDSWLLLLVNLMGGYIGYLLVQKQLFIQNDHTDKICSLFKKGNCDSILFSPVAKFMGIIGWSEVGLSYFISNLLIIVLFPQLMSYLAIINICVLPYSIWSVWYQNFKAKQWCPLCLIVQVALWMIFIINLTFHSISFPPFVITQYVLVGIIYILPFILISLSLPILIGNKRSGYMLEEMNELRMNPNVFEALLKEQPSYDVNLSTSQIIWGNKEANILVSILTNPHCGPCAEIHQHIEKLLETAGDRICVQYIFSSFDDDFDSGKFLIAAYLSGLETEKKKEIYNEWFEKGKYDKEVFFKKYGFDIYSPIVETEINRHIEWNKSADIHATPTILINGYELPYYYRIEDVIYFTSLKI